MIEKTKILVADDEEGMRSSLVDWLREDGYDVFAVEDGFKAIDKVKSEYWDILLVDLKMPGMDGIEVLREVSKIKKDIPVIIITAYATVDTAVQSMKEGAYDYIVKPIDPEELSLCIKKIIEHQKLVRENILLKKELAKSYQFQDLIGESHKMQEVFQLIRTVAPTASTILILGESGTGKELTARAIHNSGPRKDKPFIALSCGALPETLLESELFGYEKGAFTGAGSQQKGKFELADGGTIFLDDISEISPKTQIDLLRVLQEREIRRLGGEEVIKVDVRVIAATNRDLKKLVEEKKFREDLFYRLNVITINMPPLKERKEDIPLLIQHFLKKFNIQISKSIEGVSREALVILMNHSWPGNVRELENAVERAVVIASEPQIWSRDLPPEITQQTSSSIIGSKTLEELEKEHIKKVLVEKDWDIQKAARFLGIHRSTLYNKMKKYKLKKD